MNFQITLRSREPIVHAMDAKHRVTIPSRWRHGETRPVLSDALTDQTIICTPSLQQSFQRVNEKLNNDPRISASDRRQFARYYFSRALHCIIDRQGAAASTRRVFAAWPVWKATCFLVGTFDRFEVWAPDRWERASVEESSTFQQVANLIGA